ncbi:MAG: shikimate kinase [Bacteroidetes bacterium]|nr:shikimate kinase [Bacteroidota bacterium]
MDGSTQKQRSLVLLVGFMGSGKSTIGPILANVLGYRFYDIDTIIEEKAQKSIPEIFRTEGETTFRSLERATLAEVLSYTDSVIALGGGTIANPENLQLAKDNGILVYLKISPQEALHRVSYHAEDRPMLKDATGKPLYGAHLEQRIIELLQQREKFYAQSDITVVTDNQPIGVTVDEIVKRLRPFIKES